MVTVEALQEELGRLKKINTTLMRRVERNMDIQGDAFSLFQTATLLEQKVYERTAALESVLDELKRSNRELRSAKEAAELAARSKDQFLAGMSHELRTPLNAVLGLAEILQEEIYGPLNPKQLASLRTIEGSGRHLLSLINDILELARLGTVGFKQDVADVDLPELCQASLALVTAQATKKEILLNCEVSPEITRIRTDARRLKQVLVNLLGNAVKFTNRGGAIGLAVALADSGQLRIEVWDTGIGITAADCGRIFAPFVQVESTLSRKYEGTGLGLALVQQLVHLLGGEVGVESEVGKGSVFWVELPLAESSRAESAQAPGRIRSVRASAHGRLILLAEDNEANTQTIGGYLEAKGYRVELATNGRIAVEKVNTLMPDLVLMDVQMPEVDGLEAMRRIRAQAGFECLPIIALTALAMVGDRERCLTAGATDYITKPVSLKQLVALIERQLEGPPDLSTATAAKTQAGVFA